MKLVRFGSGTEWGKHGLLIDRSIFPLLGMTTTSALESLKEGDERWKQIIDQVPIPLDTVSLLPPVELPGAFLDFYTFEEHVKTCRKKRGLDMVPEWYQYPAWYNGSTRCFSGDKMIVNFPEGENKKDFELELAVVIKKNCFQVKEKQANNYIGAYTIVNDFSAREIQEKIMRIGLGPAKAKDFSTGLGPCMVTPDEIGDPRNLKMRAWVNDDLWSEGNSGSSHFTFEQMIAFASEQQVLYPGDILASGTVGSGCGLEQDRFLKKGDQITLEIDHIGKLTHYVG